MKKRGVYAVPSPREAVEMQRALHGIPGRKEHLCPGRHNRSKPMAIPSFRQALPMLDLSGQYTPHATCTAGSTRLNETGYRPDWIERQLAHMEPTRCGAPTTTPCISPTARLMMQRWADLLDEWEKTAREGRNGIPSGA